MAASEEEPMHALQSAERESAMMITPAELLDTSIAQLQTLVAFLGDQLGDGSARSASSTSEARACEEILRSLSTLILKLETAPGRRRFQRHEDCHV
jgi:hypothetical protein